ncbi:MAG: L-type lectin-domain containing protein [Calditrichia bacterium]
MAQFHVNGDAGQLEEHCYQLTPPEFDQAGTIWNLSKINLTQPFDTTFQLFLGCNDFDGGDGIVFAFQPNGVSVGNYNGHLGYAFLSPSLAIEIDTYQNPEHNDPGFDHLAIVRDGISDHQAGENLAGPVQVNPIDPDVEDCRFHDFRVSWEPDGEDLTVYWNCELRLSYSGNIINSVFGGDPEVFWGFTSGTSTVKNAQEVCIGKANELNILQDVTLCPGGEIDLFSPVQGITYTWSPPAGLNETDIPNPVASPDTTTTYTVIITDECGELLTDDITIFVEGTPIDIDFGSEDTVLCEGTTLVLDAFHAGSTYNWSTGSTDSALSVAESGFYALTLTNGECIASERIFVNFIGPPAIELGLDTVILWFWTPFMKARTIFGMMVRDCRNTK